MAEIDLILDGTATAAQVASFGEHVGGCSECAALAADRLALVDAAAAFEAVFSGDADEQPQSSRAWSSRRTWPVWIAAAAAAVVVAVVFIDRSGEPTGRAIAITGASRPSIRPSVVPSTVVTRNPEWDALIADVRRTGVLPIPNDIRELAASDTYRGSSDARTSGSVSPSGTTIDDVRPELHWPAVRGAHYEVLITTENGREVTHSPRLVESRWTCDRSLERGRTYRWQVSADGADGLVILPAPPAPPAIFRVLSADEHEQIEVVKRGAAEDHLLLGLMHAKFGEVANARRELSAYEESSRDPLARRLLAQLP